MILSNKIDRNSVNHPSSSSLLSSPPCFVYNSFYQRELPSSWCSSSSSKNPVPLSLPQNYLSYLPFKISPNPTWKPPPPRSWLRSSIAEISSSWNLPLQVSNPDLFFNSTTWFLNNQPGNDMCPSRIAPPGENELQQNEPQMGVYTYQWILVTIHG